MTFKKKILLKSFFLLKNINFFYYSISIRAPDHKRRLQISRQNLKVSRKRETLGEIFAKLSEKIYPFKNPTTVGFFFFFRGDDADEKDICFRVRADGKLSWSRRREKYG